MKRFFTTISVDRGTGGVHEFSTMGDDGQVRSQGIRFSATVFGTGRNKNNVHLEESELAAFAKTFIGKPFLQDHGRKLADRGGTIVDSKLEKDGDRQVIRQTILAVKPWAREGVLDGTIDAFSIGFDAEEYICTVCETSVFDCKHGPFAVGSKDKESGKLVEVRLRGLDGSETSAVTHPAVGGTGVDEVLSQLQAMTDRKPSGTSAGSSQAQEVEMFLKQVLEVLSLPADTAEPEALEKLKTRLSAPAVPGGLLKALGLGAEATEDQAIAKAYTLVPRAEYDEKLAKLAGDRAEELVRQGETDGKITPAMKEWAAAFAKRDAAGFAEVLKGLPKQNPNTPTPQLTVAPKPPNDEEDAEAARAAGVTLEQFRAGRDSFRSQFFSKKGGQ